MILPENGAAEVALSIPMRAEYVSIARLTAAGVANRLGFDIEAIEDIKVSLSEVCNRIISTHIKTQAETEPECKIEFILSYDNLCINFYVDNIESQYLFMPGAADSSGGFQGGSGIRVDLDKLIDEHQDAEVYRDQLQLSLISLLMDEFIVNPSENCLVSMKKYVE